MSPQRHRTAQSHFALTTSFNNLVALVALPRLTPLLNCLVIIPPGWRVLPFTATSLLLMWLATVGLRLHTSSAAHSHFSAAGPDSQVTTFASHAASVLWLLVSVVVAILRGSSVIHHRWLIIATSQSPALRNVSSWRSFVILAVLRAFTVIVISFLRRLVSVGLVTLRCATSSAPHHHASTTPGWLFVIGMVVSVIVSWMLVAFTIVIMLGRVAILSVHTVLAVIGSVVVVVVSWVVVRAVGSISATAANGRLLMVVVVLGWHSPVV